MFSQSVVPLLWNGTESEDDFSGCDIFVDGLAIGKVSAERLNSGSTLSLHSK